MPLSPSAWKQSSSDSAVFERPLGLTEQGFYWDSLYNRTADIIRAAELQVQGSCADRILSPTVLAEVWTTLKQRYPLLGASVEERSPDNIVFIVDRARLKNTVPGELSIQTIANAQEVDQVANRIHNCPGQDILSSTLLSCVRVLQETSSPNRFHVLIQSAHCISDEVAHTTVMREFLMALANPDATLEPRPDFLSTLALSSATETLYPHLDNPPRARWRRAIASVIVSRRRAKISGGHSLPRKFTLSSHGRPAHSLDISSYFSREDSQKIIQTCRSNGLTFGNVLPIIGQVAMSRVLCKHYLEGKISEEDWDFRKKEPMITAGPLNIRPFLDSSWYSSGGSTNPSLAIGLGFYPLQSMPLGPAASLRPGPGASMPDPLDMFSKQRLFHRCRSMKQTMADYLRHPLFCEMSIASLPARLSFLKNLASRWQNEGPVEKEDSHLSVKAQASTGFVLNHGGATVGNLDSVLPSGYAGPSQEKDEKTPAIELLTIRTFLHCRPTELYLGASTFRKQLKYYIFWDRNVYDEDVVEEWLKELVECTLAYLT